jgi:acetyl esterase/lipase
VISRLDLTAYALKVFFNCIGLLGASALNLGQTRDLQIITNLRYGSGREQRLDVFRPTSAKRRRLPVLIYFHGGGWISANKRIYKGIAATFSRQGFLTFNVNYRLAPKSKFLAPLQDAALAMDWVDRNAAGYGGDPNRMVLAGDSAGAQIASWYASAVHNDSLFRRLGTGCSINKVSAKGLLLFYGVYDFDTVLATRFPFIDIYARSFLGADDATYAKNSKLASPILQITERLPPVWLCAGEEDGLFTQTTDYAEALNRSGVLCRTLLFTREYRAAHGFLFFRWLRSSKAAFAAAIRFLRDHADLGEAV